MKTERHTMTRILLIAGLLVGLGRGTAEASLLLQHSFEKVHDPNAEDFLHSFSNAVKRYDVLGIEYWSPEKNEVDAEIVYRFNAGAKIDQALLYARVDQFDDGDYGLADIWGSRNGQDWTWLAGSYGITGNRAYFYGNSDDTPYALPSNLLGGNEIWIKATMYTVGDPRMAQWARNYEYNPPDAKVFEIQLYSNAVPEPATIAVWSILGLCGVGYGLRRKMRRAS